jgi:hypothetical protein
MNSRSGAHGLMRSGRAAFFVATRVSCASARFCRAVDHRSRVDVSTRPMGGTAAWRRTQITPTQLVGADCRSAPLCLIIDNHRHVLLLHGPGRRTECLARRHPRQHAAVRGSEPGRPGSDDVCVEHTVPRVHRHRAAVHRSLIQALPRLAARGGEAAMLPSWPLSRNWLRRSSSP